MANTTDIGILSDIRKNLFLIIIVHLIIISAVLLGSQFRKDETELFILLYGVIQAFSILAISGLSRNK